MLKVLAVPIVAAVLILGVSAAAFFVLIKPRQDDLEATRGNINTQQGIVDGKKDAEQDRAEAKIKRREANEKLARYVQEKGIPISLADPDEAAWMWVREVHRHEAPLLKTFLEASGVAVMQGTEFPAPPMTPPTVVEHDMVAIAGPEPIAVSVQGTLEQVETLYRSIDNFPRVLAIDGLTIAPTAATQRGTDDKVTASFNLYMYALVEPAPGGGAATAGGAAPAGGGAQRGTGAPQMMQPGGASGMPTPTMMPGAGMEGGSAMGPGA